MVATQLCECVDNDEDNDDNDQNGKNHIVP